MSMREGLFGISIDSLKSSHNWYGEGQPTSEDEMGYYALIMMGHAYYFIGDVAKGNGMF